MTFKSIFFLIILNILITMIHAARDGHFEIVELLLSQEGIEIDCENI